MELIQLQYHSELLNFIDIPVLDLYVNTCPNLIPAVFNSGNCVVPWQTKTAKASRDPPICRTILEIIHPEPDTRLELATPGKV